MNNYKITFISSQEFDEKIQGTGLFKDCKLTTNQRDGSFGLCIAFAENHHVLILGRVSYLLHLSQRCFLSFARLLLFR
ncbi:MAG: hypothetical protein MR860_10860, partial [Prevotella sp.]|nr:hypothetical protein [Prevotella sp.]